MTRNAWPARALVAALIAAGATGCQRKPRIVIPDLPGERIVEARPAARAAPPVETPQRPRLAPPPGGAGVPEGWVPAKVLPRPWRWIVVHHSATDAGSAAVFDRWHRARGWDELGYHFVITNGRGGADGKVEVGSRWRKQKWGAHCKTPGNAHNDFGIGVCVVGDFSNRLPTAAQLRSLRKLVFFLSDRHGIEPGNVIGHRDAPGASTECPGDALHQYVHRTLRNELLRRQQMARK